jgi:hypothetical protein
MPRSKRITAIFGEGYRAIQKQEKEEKKGMYTNHLDIYLYLPDSNPGH